MGAWGMTAFESDGALDFLGDFKDGHFAEVSLDGLFHATEGLDVQREEEWHAAAELLAATLNDDWSGYRVGGGSGLFPKIRGDEAALSETRAWLPDDAVALVPLLREGVSEAQEDPERLACLAMDVGTMADQMDTIAASTRGSNPLGWDDPEGRAGALDATAGRLRRAIG